MVLTWSDVVGLALSAKMPRARPRDRGEPVIIEAPCIILWTQSGELRDTTCR